jgi:phosphatidyl-myo-inositol dimannoside synthase
MWLYGRAVSIHVVLPEVMSHGGMQRYNQQLIHAVETFARIQDTRTVVWSLNDHPRTPGMRAYGQDRKRFVRSILISAWRDQPKVVIIGHVHFAMLAAAYRVISPRSRLYVLAHGKEVEAPLDLLSRAALHLYTGALVVSQSTRASMVQQQGIPARRVHILYYGFGPAGASPCIASQDEAGKDAIALLSVTRLTMEDRYKGIHITLAAISRLLPEFPGLRYTVVGDGSDRSWLQHRAYELGIADRIRFVGQVSDAELNELYAACDVFVLPSTHEGLGIVYLEALARGKPVIGVRAGGVADVVVHEANGLLLEEQTVDGLAAAIRRLALDPRLRRRLGNWGRQHTLPAFSQDHMVSALTGILALESSQVET